MTETAHPDAPPPAPWPEVPACYGWLSLDRRGNWRLQGERISHPGLIAFLNTHYDRDAAGNWLVHNGPQRVFVALDYAPWVLRLQTDGSVRAHTGADAGAIAAAYLDDEGNVLLRTSLGIGLLDDRDLPALLADCRQADGAPATDVALLAALEGCGRLVWQGLALEPLKRAEAAARFGYQPSPAPP